MEKYYNLTVYSVIGKQELAFNAIDDSIALKRAARFVLNGGMKHKYQVRLFRGSTKVLWLSCNESIKEFVKSQIL